MVWDDSTEKAMMFTEELHRQGIVKEINPSVRQKGRGDETECRGEARQLLLLASLRKAKNKGRSKFLTFHLISNLKANLL